MNKQTNQKNVKVQVVLDGSRPRVKPLNSSLDFGGWVRFPKHLRVVGAVYEVESLNVGAAGSWVATGCIIPVNKEAMEATLVSGKSGVA